MPSDKRRQRVDEALEILRLTAYADRSVTTLSGGQQQRVAIARAIALQPKILLMDEPLSNLDYALQTRLRSELRELFKGLGLTVLYVTHNQTEAMEIADSMAVMHEGQIEQIGPPEAIYNRPASEFVARFMGETNLVPIATFDEAACRAGTPFGWVTLDPSTCGAPRVGGSHSLAFRPESLRLGAAVGNTTPITGTVLQRFYQGPSCLYTIEASGCRLRLRFGPEIRLAIGDTVTFSLQGADCRIVATDDLSPAPESP